jgi:antirestriction protein ArdC
MTNSIQAQATHTKAVISPVSHKIQAGYPKPDISKSKATAKKIKEFKKIDMYQIVTDKIIAALDNGVKPWVCPWQKNTLGGGFPINYETKKNYSGVNVLLLWAAALEAGYSSNQFLTYKQANNLGGQVRKGEKGTSLIFYTNWEKENDKGEKDIIPMLKSFTVFNVEQIDGLCIEDALIETEQAPMLSIENIEQFMINTGASIKEQGDRAFYSLAADAVTLPRKALFSDIESFYATAFHELTHWTRHPTRLNREKNYNVIEEVAFEELIAELGSAFLMAEFNLFGDVQHDSYIASWLSALRNDKKWIFKASSAASKAHQFLMNTHV